MRTLKLAAAAVVLAATTGTTSRPAVSSTAATRAEHLSASDRCPSLPAADTLPFRPGGGRLRGDIDGDGRLDMVSIRYALSSHASCGFLLVVETSNRTLAVRVPESYKPPEDVRDWSFPEPYLGAIVQLAPDKAQIVVARWHGASNTGVTLYGFSGGKLVPLRFGPRIIYPSTTLPLYGSVGTSSTYVRCTRGGPLTVLTEGPIDAKGRRWFARKRVYRLTQETMQITRTRTVRASQHVAEATFDRWGPAMPPFRGCIVARGKRL